MRFIASFVPASRQVPTVVQLHPDAPKNPQPLTFLKSQVMPGATPCSPNSLSASNSDASFWTFTWGGGKL